MALLTLAHAPADVVRWLIVDLGLGIAPALWAKGDETTWPAYVGKEPDGPDNCLTLYGTTPRKDAKLMRTGEPVYHHGVQVRIRSSLETVGFLKANAIDVGLNTFAPVPKVVKVGANTYRVDNVSTAGVVRGGQLAPTSKRMFHTINATVSLTQLT